jgi:hypothetical protein
MTTAIKELPQLMQVQFGFSKLMVKKGSFVEVRKVLLEPSERAEHLPEETKQVPFEARIRGFLLRDARLGEEAEIETRIGRIVRGTVVAVDPPFTYGFGRPVRELIDVSRELRKEIGQS